MTVTFLAVVPGLLIWVIILCLPWRPWRNQESLDAEPHQDCNLSEVTILIPARNEAATIGATLAALKQHYTQLPVILIDDQSTDNTVAVAQSINLTTLKIITGSDLPKGWSGKLWALEQGRQHITTRYVLLLDADIVLTAELIDTALQRLQQNQLQLLSLMVQLKMEAFLEKLFLPAFIFFFKLLYPFQLANRPDSKIAAAAGGFILVDTQALAQVGGFSAIKATLIDDCALAKILKHNGYNTWLGLTHSATSIRDYNAMASLWTMVTRTAYTQLAHSPLRLLVCTILMIAAFSVPLLALLSGEPRLFTLGMLTLLIQAYCYLPTLRYYAIEPGYMLTLPFVASIYLLMTWWSAGQYYLGQGANWKGRYYN